MLKKDEKFFLATTLTVPLMHEKWLEYKLVICQMIL